jgi:cytochrome c oxidase subunit 2
MDFFIPEQASTFAPRVDFYFYFLTVMVTVLTVGIFIALIAIAVKYRRKEGEERLSHPLHNVMLEITWTVIPTIVVIGLFAWATWLYADYMNEPEGGLEIDVVGKQWMWKIQHPNGVREVNTLHVPVGRPVVLTLASQDVLHDFYIPAFRVKQDAIPGRFTKMWFEATKTGTFHLFCAEYCGTEHSKMIGTVTVMEETEYAEWLQGGPKKSPIEAGEFLFTQRGCITCHSGQTDARGPNLEGSFGETTILKGGTEMVRDEEYLRESIMEPGKRVVEGYTPLMPSFKNQLTDEDVMNLVAYIKSLEKE